MAEISNIQAKRFKELETKRHQLSIRKLQQNHSREYKKIVKDNEATISDLKRNFDKKITKLDHKLEKKLIIYLNQKNQ